MTQWVGYILEGGKVKRFKWSLDLDISPSGKLKADGVENKANKLKLEGKVTHTKKRLVTGQDDFVFTKTIDKEETKLYF